MDDLFSVEDLSKLLRISEYTIRQKIREGKIQAVKLGSRWRISKSEISKIISGGV